MEDVLVYFMKIMLVSLVVFVFVFVLKVVVLLWWRPRKIEDHFSKQGIRGPPYRFFVGNAKELVSLMLKASSQPMPISHNILPRVLSFYHHWRKIYGTSLSLSFFTDRGWGTCNSRLVRQCLKHSGQSRFLLSIFVNWFENHMLFGWILILLSLLFSFCFLQTSFYGLFSNILLFASNFLLWVT